MYTCNKIIRLDDNSPATRGISQLQTTQISSFVQGPAQRLLWVQQVGYADHIPVAGGGIDYVLADRSILAGGYTVRRD